MMWTGPILIVDDEPQNLAVMRQILGEFYQLIFARSGTEAILAARDHNPALILLDIQMPGMNGYDTCRALKSDPRTEPIPVIFVTALEDVGHEAAGFDVGAVDYIVKPVSTVIVQARVKTHLSLVRATQLEHSHQDAIYMLGEAGHFNDTDTGVHIWRMAGYAAAIAEACGWEPNACRQLELAAAMHDTGKIGIPNSILSKPSKLDSAEWSVMKTHSRIGHDILARSAAPLFQLAAEIALYHHERWNGEGYPDGLSGESIPLSARIVAVADVFDALTMHRPYKAAWPTDRALAMMCQDVGNHFDPKLVEKFMSILPRILDIKARWDGPDSSKDASK